MTPFDYPHRIETIRIVGLGGTGAQVARTVCRMVYDMKQRKLQYPRVVFTDPDTVDMSNVGRQLFTPADVGHNKAEVAMRRFNAALGLATEAEPQKFSPHLRYGLTTLIIGCVDSHTARRDIAKAQSDEDFLWIDAGNNHASGQVVIGNRGQIDKLPLNHPWGARYHLEALPTAALLFPQLLQPDTEDKTVSCAELMERGSQSLIVNDWMAAAVAGYVYKLLYRKPIESFVTYVSDEIRNVPIEQATIRQMLGLEEPKKQKRQKRHM